LSAALLAPFKQSRAAQFSAALAFCVCVFSAEAAVAAGGWGRVHKSMARGEAGGIISPAPGGVLVN